MAGPARRPRRPVRGERGTTLLEMTVALAALGVILVALLLTWRQGVVAYIQGSETADLQQEARVAHQRMTEELRLAGMNPCNQPVAPGLPVDAIAEAQATTVTLTYFSRGANDPRGSINCDAGTPEPLAYRRVTYAYDAVARTLTRDPDGPNQPAGSGPLLAQPLTGATVQGLNFAYLPCLDTDP